MTNANVESLPFLPSEQRLNAYNLIIDGCSHIYSKNKLQKEKALNVLNTLVPLTKDDPYFLAHLTSYVMKNSKAKDLQVFLAYVSTLSTADGTPFSPGSEYIKPNLRYVGAAAVHMLDPKLVSRVLEIANTKYAVTNYFNESRHFPNTLRTSIKKYIKYREETVDSLKKAKNAGFGNVIQKIYRGIHLSPSEEAAKILRWQQKDKKIEFAKSDFDFGTLSDLEIAEKIRKDKMKVLTVLGALPRKMTPVIAVALLEQASGDQAVILHATFKDAGVLNDPEVKKLYEEKIRTAKTALDRVERIKTIADDAESKAMMAEARSEVRKQETEGLGRVYVHLDDSGSMQGVREFMIQKGSIIAECINNPKENFGWGMFGSQGQNLPLPDKFTKEAFMQALFGYRDGGGTWAFALYPTARDFNANIDIFISDQEEQGNLSQQIREYHQRNPDKEKPKACVIVNFGRLGSDRIKKAYEDNGIPVAVLRPDALTESALVVQSVRDAIKGPVSIIEEIMETPLLKLPDYYFNI